METRKRNKPYNNSGMKNKQKINIHIYKCYEYNRQNLKFIKNE